MINEYADPKLRPLVLILCNLHAHRYVKMAFGMFVDFVLRSTSLAIAMVPHLKGWPVT